MIATPLRLWLCTDATDMRRSYRGLASLVRVHFERAPNCGDAFVFINRRRTQMKCLYYERGGYCIWGKRLDRGHFRQLERSGILSATEFAALLDGLDVTVRRRRLRSP